MAKKEKILYRDSVIGTTNKASEQGTETEREKESEMLVIVLHSLL